MRPHVADWWGWKWPVAGQTSYWKTPYRVGGELMIKSEWSGLRVSFAALDENWEDGTTTWFEELTVSPRDAPPRGALTIFGEPEQAWGWTSWSSPPRGDEYEKRFNYGSLAAFATRTGELYTFADQGGSWSELALWAAADLCRTDVVSGVITTAMRVGIVAGNRQTHSWPDSSLRSD